jgi:hypothetical protein
MTAPIAASDHRAGMTAGEPYHALTVAGTLANLIRGPPRDASGEETCETPHLEQLWSA